MNINVQFPGYFCHGDVKSVILFFRMADDEFHDAVEGDEFDFEPSLERFHYTHS